MEVPVRNDADIFWEVTKSPEGRLAEEKDEVVDGNHHDNKEITTHDHVDRTIGHVPPTKRVKKILPPFEEGKKQRNLRGIDTHLRTKDKKNTIEQNVGIKNNNKKEAGETTKETSKEPNADSSDFFSEVTQAKITQKTTSKEISRAWETTFGTTPITPEGTLPPSGDNDSKIHHPEFSSPKANIGMKDLSFQNKKEEQNIEGIRLVPDDDDVRYDGEEEKEEKEEMNEGEEGVELDEESTIQKSIWDLLKEREQFETDRSYLDVEPKNSKIETGNETTLETPAEKTKSLYDHFDADSAEVEFETENFKRGSNIEKHELPLSYAASWLQAKDKLLDVTKKPKVNASGDLGTQKDWTKIPQDVSNLLQLSQNHKSLNGVTVSIINSGGSDISRFGRRPSKWYLLLLTGNSTIVKLRRQDFTKYLKLNLAARLSVEYDDVKVNKVILAPPKVLVNVSVFAPSEDVAEESQVDFKEKMSDKGEAPLYKLAETNATLLELSGEEFHVIQFLSLNSEKPEAEAQKDGVPNSVSMVTRQDDVEFIAYTFLGSAFACALLLTFFVTLNKYFKKVSDFDWPSLRTKQTAWKVHDDSEPEKDEFDGVSPAVIYSGGFPQIRGSWMGGGGLGSASRASSTLLHQSPSIEMGPSSPHQKLSAIYPDLEDRPSSSPRHSKLQIYNCDAESVVIPLPLQSRSLSKPKGEGSDTHPLDVRIRGEKSGEDNPNFTN